MFSLSTVNHSKFGRNQIGNIDRIDRIDRIDQIDRIDRIDRNRISSRTLIIATELLMSCIITMVSAVH